MVGNEWLRLQGLEEGLWKPGRNASTRW